MIGVRTAGPQYGASAIARRHAPPSQTDYGAYRECLRLEFQFVCAYCLSTEREAAAGEAYGGFEIEHFKPKGRGEFRHLRNDYLNLLWACHACNRAKGHRWPHPKERRLGMRFVDPTKEALGRFLQLKGDRVGATAANPAGEYMIEEIRLNSSLHIERRRKRANLEKKLALVEGIAQVLRDRNDPQAGNGAAIAKQLDELVEGLAQIRLELERHAPLSDAPLTCLCSG